MNGTKNEIKQSMPRRTLKSDIGELKEHFKTKAHIKRLKEEEKLRKQITKEKKLLVEQESVLEEKKKVAEKKQELHDLHLERTKGRREKLHKLESGLSKVGKGIFKGLKKFG